MLFEGGKSLDFNNDVTDAGLSGIMRIMKHLGMWDSSTGTLPKIRKRATIIQQSSWIRARYSGLFRSFISAGRFVKKGDSIGSISDPFVEFESVIKSNLNGHIIGMNHATIVTKGDALYHIGW